MADIPICCLLVLAAVLHLLLLPLFCRRLPYSAYFDPFSSTSTKRDGGREEAAALEQLANLARREEGAQQQHGSQLAVLVLTSRRQQGVSYLGRSLLALHREVRATTKYQPLVFVCTGDEGMDKEYSGGLPFPLIQPNESLPSQLPPGNRKAKRDFVFCAGRMDEMLPKDVEHILILEDDTLVMQGIFSTLSAWMTFHQERLEAEPWLDIKLYLNPRLRGWAWNQLPLVELLSSTTLLSIVLNVILVSLLNQKAGKAKAWVSLVILWMAILAALLLVGRQHWVQWRRLHPQLYLRREAPDAFTQAVLYPRQRLVDAARYIGREQGCTPSTPFDLSLGEYRRREGLTGHLLEPNLVRHIGVSSAFGVTHQLDRDGGDSREFLAEYPI